jgi:hypothetical protein
MEALIPGFYENLGLVTRNIRRNPVAEIGVRKSCQTPLKEGCGI